MTGVLGDGPSSKAVVGSGLRFRRDGIWMVLGSHHNFNPICHIVTLCYSGVYLGVYVCV